MKSATLTDSALERLTVSDKRIDVSDAGRGSVRGLEIRCSSNSRIWYIRFRSPIELGPDRQGARRRMRIGKWPALGVADARKLALAILAEVEHGNDPSMQVETSLNVRTFGDVLDLYIARHIPKLKPSTKVEVTRQIETYVRPILGKIAVNRVTPALLAKTWRDIDKRGKLPTTKRVHSLMLKLGKVAAEFGWIAENKMIGLTYSFTPTRRDRYLSEIEIRTFWRQLDEVPVERLTRCALQLMLVTGQRTSEVLGARISELDLVNKTWTLPAARMKKGLRHTVPICDLAVELFRQAIELSAKRRGDTDYIFPVARRIQKNKLSGVTIKPMEHQVTARAIARNYQRMGLEAFTGHDLRRTFATQLAEAVISIDVIETLLAHRSGTRGALVATYNHSGLEVQMREAVEKWEGRFRGVIGRDQTPS